jgi:hypothetical protein
VIVFKAPVFSIIFGLDRMVFKPIVKLGLAW